MKWWVWLIAALIAAGGISALINPSGDMDPSAASQPTQTDPTGPSTPLPAAESAPLDLEAFLNESGIAFESVSMSARKAVIYVPIETSNEQAQQIANDAMLYVCKHAAETGESAPAANRVEVSDGVSPASPDYDAAEHPSGFATEEVCKQN
ncbi:hypothetical protein [Microbacterium sp. AK031]|uniref:hypothetical protein n=1 Tax=Microbacterium sp. AK031 TaxID=2723076 RepID=UPI002169CEFD|nr:hypothetical protein [Microbacterium sp. AK031]MCS3844783.1 hypothetical protein [Microbacterium sp. AK031]